MRWTRSLTRDEALVVARAREGARLRYEGRVIAHRSCGIAIAETFARPTRPYQALRKGGITGQGECGTRLGGRMVLGELLGDPDPSGAPHPLMVEAIQFYDAQWSARTETQQRHCDGLVAQFSAFRSPERASFCTGLAAETAALLAETLLRAGGEVQVIDVSVEPGGSVPSVR